MSEYIIEVADYVPPFDPAVRATTLHEEVVRCRECRHSGRTLHGMPADGVLVCRVHLVSDYPTDPDGYCHLGERRSK